MMRAIPPHPNLVAGACRGGVLELERGKRDLYHHVARQPGYTLPPSEALAVTRQVARGLLHLHAGGYCHNDVKLENVLLFEEGEEEPPRWKLADLDLCHPVGRPPPHLRGKVPGTWAYASPEKEASRRGHGHDHCPLASDMWSLGVLLHVCAKGTFPNGTTSPAPLVARYRPQEGAGACPIVEVVLSRLLCPRRLRWTAEEASRYLEAAPG